MSRTRTLDNLVSDVRLRADMVGSGFVTDAEVGEYVNQSLAELYDLILGSWGDDYYITSTSKTTTGGTNVVTVPSDMYKLLGLDFQDASGWLTQLNRIQWADRARWINMPRGRPQAYMVFSGNFVIAPTPDTVYTLVVNYVPNPPRLVAGDGTSVFDGVAGWEEYAILDGAIKCLTKENALEAAGVLMAQKAAVKARIEAMAPARDANLPACVGDSSGWQPWI